MLYYFEKTKIGSDNSYVFISIHNCNAEKKTWMFDPTANFSDAEKEQLQDVVPASGMVAATNHYTIVNFTHDARVISVLVRRVNK